MTPGTRIVVRGDAYEVVHTVEAGHRTRCADMVRAITVKPVAGDGFYIGMERRDGTISALDEL